MSMIEGFNDLISYINRTGDYASDTQEDSDYSDDEENHPLENSSSAAQITRKLRTLLSTFVNVDSPYTSLTDLGLNISSDGTVTLDEDTLDEAFATDPEAVKNLFLGDSENEITGLADLFNDTLGDMVSTSGIASTEIDEAQARIDRLDEDIEKDTVLLEKKYETMAEQFAQLDTYISQLESEASALTSMIDSFNNSGDD